MYEWEGQNFYEILDLPTPPSTASRRKRQSRRASISSADVKRAYRKAAQKYHPDKVAKNQTMTVEERNARFARIAEAYEVLNNNEKRDEYDQFLLDCEDHLSGQEASSSSSSNSWSSIFGDLSTDPRRVFEEFFFGSSSSEPTSWEDVGYDDGRQHTRRKSSTPIRVYESREIHRDPYTGVEVLRMLQTEEFETDTEGMLYYRISAQDFVEQYDRFRGPGYVPISELFLVEEGYRHEETHHAASEPESLTNTLSPGEYMMPESAMLKSSNGRYYAGLSSECDLLIMTESWEEEEEIVFWSLGTYVPPAHMYSHGGCFLGLRGPHLVLALGSPDQPGSILWYSDVPDTIVEEEERILAMGGEPSLFIARLDDDGSLAVYRHETSSPQSAEEKVEYESSWWYKVLRPPHRKPRTRAARALVDLQDWFRERLVRRQRSQPFPRETCIYATGPAGCNTHGRKIVHFAHDVGYSVKQTMVKIDTAIDSFVDNDEDPFDTVVRAANRATDELLRMGRSLLRTVKRFLHSIYDFLEEIIE